MADLLRQAVYSRLAGYEDVNDSERLAQELSGCSPACLVLEVPQTAISRTSEKLFFGILTSFDHWFVTTDRKVRATSPHS